MKKKMKNKIWATIEAFLLMWFVVVCWAASLVFALLGISLLLTGTMIVLVALFGYLYFKLFEDEKHG